jgi:hypothetical protein
MPPQALLEQHPAVRGLTTTSADPPEDLQRAWLAPQVANSPGQRQRFFTERPGLRQVAALQRVQRQHEQVIEAQRLVAVRSTDAQRLLETRARAGQVPAAMIARVCSAMAVVRGSLMRLATCRA